MNFIREGGVIMWVLVPVAVVTLGVAVAAALRLRSRAGRDPRLETGIDAVLFWGIYGLVIGVLGTVVGLFQAARAIERLGPLDPRMIWGGIRVTLTTSIFGLVLFSLALLVWFGLRSVYRRRLPVGA